MSTESEKSKPDSVRDEAARQVDKRNREQVKQIIRTNLQYRIRKREGTSDIAQEVFLSYFKKGDIPSDPDKALPLLLTIAQRKCKNAARSHKAGKRDITLERDLRSNDADEKGGKDHIEEIPDPTPVSAEEKAIINEEVSLLSTEDVKVTDMRTSGCTFAEIAESLNWSEEKARTRWIAITNRWIVDLKQNES